MDLPKIKKTNEKLIDSLFIAHKKAKSNFNEFLSNLSFYKRKYIKQVSKDYLLVSNKISNLKDFGYIKLFCQNIISTNF